VWDVANESDLEKSSIWFGGRLPETFYTYGYTVAGRGGAAAFLVCGRPPREAPPVPALVAVGEDVDERHCEFICTLDGTHAMARLGAG